VSRPLDAGLGAPTFSARAGEPRPAARAPKPPTPTRPGRGIPRTLLLYLGNPIAGDDAVGLQVGAQLASELRAARGAPGSGASSRGSGPEGAGPAAPSLTAREFGGSPLDLLSAVEGFDRLILIDAVATGAPLGTVQLFDEQALSARRADAYPHGLNIPEALALGRRLGAELPARIHLIGIEVAPVQRFREGLSPELRRKLPSILLEARRLLDNLLKE
jgi:hydrogenase maturation protease